MLEHAAPSGVMRPLSRRPSAHTADSGASTSGSEVDPAMPPPLRAGQPLRRVIRSAKFLRHDEAQLIHALRDA